MTQLKWPPNVTYLEAFRAALKSYLSEAKFNDFFHTQGYSAADVENWCRWFEAHPDACNAEEVALEKEKRRKIEEEIAEKQRVIAKTSREPAKKEKALTEAKAMLTLAKKAEAIWKKNG